MNIYLISIGDTVQIKSSGKICKITSKTINKINGEWEHVWFMDNDFSKPYTSDKFEPVKGQCKYI